MTTQPGPDGAESIETFFAAPDYFQVLGVQPVRGRLALARVVVAASGLLAAYVPARRASRVDPVPTFRTEWRQQGYHIHVHG